VFHTDEKVDRNKHGDVSPSHNHRQTPDALYVSCRKKDRLLVVRFEFLIVLQVCLNSFRHVFTPLTSASGCSKKKEGEERRCLSL